MDHARRAWRRRTRRRTVSRSMASDERTLVVTADDFGVSAGVNAAVVRAHRERGVRIAIVRRRAADVEL